MEDTPTATSPREAALISLADWGVMVPLPNVAGDAILLAYPNPGIYQAVNMSFDARHMQAMEAVGRSFCSLRNQYGLRVTINKMRQSLQEMGLNPGHAFLASSLCVSLLSRASDDLNLLFTLTLPRVREGEATTLPLSPMHIYTFYWMAQAINEDLLFSPDGEDQSLFSSQQDSAHAAKTVMDMARPVWNLFQNEDHPALHLLSYSEGLADTAKARASKAAENLTEPEPAAV
jgi:hypothetical protein